MGQLYLCDQRACEHCHPPCRHTEDIEHAVNFKKDPEGNYWEQNRLLCILRPTCRMKADDIKNMSKLLEEQIRENHVLVVPDYMEVIGKDPIFFGEENELCQKSTEPAQTVDPV